MSYYTYFIVCLKYILEMSRNYGKVKVQVTGTDIMVGEPKISTFG